MLSLDRPFHAPGPLEGQHALHQEPQASDAPENTHWYIVENGQCSVCLMGFSPHEATAFEIDAAEYGTIFYPFGQGQDAEEEARDQLDLGCDEYRVYYPKVADCHSRETPVSTEEMWRQYRERGPEDVEPEANPEPSTDCYSLETPISTEEMWRQYEREANLAETCELFKNL